MDSLKAGTAVVVAVFFALGTGRAWAAPSAGFFSSAGVGSMSTARVGAVAAPLPDGKVLIAGGSDNSRIVSSAELFDPATGTFSSAAVGSMSTAREGASAAALPDGKVLIAGGSDNSRIVSSAELFDPATHTFSSARIGSMSTARFQAVAAPLPNGKVLIAGGYDGHSYLSNAELFEPATNTFSSAGIGSMSTVRFLPAATPLPNGKVLIVGGGDGGPGGAPLESAELFDPATNTFSSAGLGAMSTARESASASPLPNGEVLIAGGDTGFGGALLSSAELFDPAADTFSSAGLGAMRSARDGASASPLPNGEVLIAGGLTSTASASPTRSCSSLRRRRPLRAATSAIKPSRNHRSPNR